MRNYAYQALYLIPKVAASLSVALGFLVLVGWYTNNITLIQVFPIFVPMQFNTALGFFVCGIGILSQTFGRNRLALACSLVVVVIGFVTLLQYVFSMNLGVDQLLMKHYITVKTSHPGRMAPNTALCFGLSGAAMLILNRAKRTQQNLMVVGILGSITVALGVVSLGGYLSGVDTAYGWGNFTQMAVHTAVGFIVLGTGVLAFAWFEGLGEKTWMPDWIVFPAGIGMATVFLTEWQAMNTKLGAEYVFLPVFILITGLLTTVLLVSTIQLAQMSRRRAKNVEEVNAKLKNEIIERKQASVALLESEEKFRTIITNTEEIVFLVDKNGIFLLSEGKGLSKLGLNPGQVVGNSVFELYKDYPDMLDEMRKALNGEAVVTEQNVGEHYFRSWYTPQINAKGEITGLLGLAVNITEQKQAEEKLKKTTHDLGERLKELNCLYRISELGDKKNTTVEEMLQIIADLIPPSWQYPEITCAQITIGDQSYKSDNFKETEWLQSQEIIVFKKKTGKVSVYLLEEKPESYEGPFLKEERDLLNDIAERIRKILERKQTENEKTNLENRLQQAMKMEAIGTLAGGIAHDFNNILGTVLGYTEMAKEDAPPGTQFQEDLDKVLIGANRAKDLVKQILAFSRQAEVERIPIKIQPLVKEGLKMLRATIPTTISITEEIDPKSGTILADPTQVHQILMNLCTNAYHAMEETGGALSVILKTTFIGPDEKELLLHVSPGEYVEFTVTDTGSGIGPDVIKKIFDPYFTTKGIGKGTGMGLSIIHGIVSDYGGTITVESELGKGSTFHVYFPVVEKDALPEIKEDRDIPGGKERILFVDDEELLAEMGKDMLERLGYHVTVRRSSLEALETFQNTPSEFDLVITDQAMPDMTGSDLSRRMMQIRPDIPIILCTGYSNLIDKDSAKGLGIKEFALKPLTKGVLAKLIREVLDAS